MRQCLPLFDYLEALAGLAGGSRAPGSGFRKDAPGAGHQIGILCPRHSWRWVSLEVTHGFQKAESQGEGK